MAKTISIFGHSISTFKGVTAEGNRIYYDSADTNRTGVSSVEDTWWARLAKRLGHQLLANASYSGSMVDGRAFPAGRSIERARQVLGPDGSQPDEIVVFIGINDYGWGGAAFQERGGSEACPTLFENVEEGFVPGDAPAGELQRFADAYDEMLENLRSVAPEADIWCMTLLPGRAPGSPHSTFCYSLRGIPLEEYNKVIKCVAIANGCKVADVAGFGLDYVSTDGTHPNLLGMEQLADLAFASMTGGKPDAELFAEELASERMCLEPTCVGCQHAASTGVKWSCVCLK